MDELSLIRDLGRSAPSRSTDELAPARARLVDAIGREGRHHRLSPFARHPRIWARLTLRSVRPGVRIGVVTGLAAAVVAVTLVVTARPTAAPPTVDAAATRVLNQAAAAAVVDPAHAPRPNQFVYQRGRAGGVVREEWLSVDGTHDGLGEEQPLPGCRDGRQRVGGKSPGATVACTPDPAYLPNLPTDPAGLAAYLHDHYNANHDSPNSTGKAVDELLDGHYLRAAQWSALFRTLATVPGLRLHRHVTDPGGRPAVGLSWSEYAGPRAPSGELFLDPVTHRYSGIRAGESDGEAILLVAIVDRVGQRP